MTPLEIMHGPYVVRHDTPFIAARTLMHSNGYFDTPSQDVLDQYAQHISSLDAEHKRGNIDAQTTHNLWKVLEATMVDVIMTSHLHEDSLHQAA